MELKKATTYEEQIAILKERGLLITDEERARWILSNVNYYVLAGYFHQFKAGNGKYVEGLTFDKIYGIYQFDCHFNSLLLSLIEVIEHTIKTKISYILAHNYPQDPCCYKNAALFTNQTEHQKMLEKFCRTVERNKNIPFVSHHIVNYNGQFPIWVAIELFTLGNIKHLYANLQPHLKDEIAKEFKTTHKVFLNWVDNIRQTRNLLAHQMRIYSVNLRYSPKICKNNHEYKIIKNRIFDQLYLMKILYYDNHEWTAMLNRLRDLIVWHSEYVELADIGFPPNWMEILTKE